MAGSGNLDIGELNRRARPKSIGAETRRRLQSAAERLQDDVEPTIQAYRAAGLSDRQAFVATYRALGFTDRAIAGMAGLSPATVDEERRHVAERYRTAKRLVAAVESPSVVDVVSTRWGCPRCGHDNELAQIPIERDLETGQTHLRCYGCRGWTTIDDPRRSE